jgi:hypothetical protein
MYIYYVEESRPPLCSSGQEFLAAERRCAVFPVRHELNLYMLCRRKWSIGKSSWLQIQRSGFDSRRYQIF